MNRHEAMDYLSKKMSEDKKLKKAYETISNIKYKNVLHEFRFLLRTISQAKKKSSIVSSALELLVDNYGDCSEIANSSTGYI